jgi:long-chain fatty acid transport protein
MSNSTIFKLSVAATALVLAGSVYASGFGLYNSSVRSMGSAYSGAAAAGKDASFDGYNAAQAAFMKKPEISAGAAFVNYDIKNTNTAGDSSYKGAPVIPNFHAVYPFSKKMTFAFDVTAPFGLKTDYSWTPPVVGNETISEIEVMRINPSVAYKVSSNLAVAVGIDYDTGKAKLGAYAPGPAKAVNDLSGDGVGWNLGLLYKLNNNTKMGLGYYSETKVKATGNLEAAVTKQAIKSTLDFPSMVTFSVYHDLSSKMDVGFSAFYNGWSSMKNIVITGGPGQPPTVLGFKNTMYYALGTDYKYNSKLTVSTGVGYDETPTNDKDRSIRLPDSNRTIVSLGACYKVASNFTVDGSFVHFIGGSVATKTGTPPTDGSSETTANEFAVAANMTF